MVVFSCCAVAVLTVAIIYAFFLDALIKYIQKSWVNTRENENCAQFNHF